MDDIGVTSKLGTLNLEVEEGYPELHRWTGSG